ncbi:hypothetical protein [Paenibacillus soyae]|uniref:Uncharacterized protein n=1 Tax=Paenibacillus soyae TaxID=2969249 RepID=A0A9X2MP80_9BACL|nr:hypothetical protein [Paenibacillus soyae]MCR2805663.1 hypothetical protein [Paenibacillus soyae]
MPSSGSSLAAEAYTKAAFAAVVDAIIPLELWMAGAFPNDWYEFVIKQIDHSQFVSYGSGAQAGGEALSLTTAKLLDIGAQELLRRGLMIMPMNNGPFVGGGLFARLSRIDRLRTIAILNQVAVPTGLLPPPYRNNPGLVQTMMDSLFQLTMFGYDSEWAGYGTTRLLPPDEQRVEFFPPAWRQIGYPGPSFGYRALRGCYFVPPSAEGRNGDA